MAKLSSLSLSNTKITDAGLENLKGLPHLGTLSLDKTLVTDNGFRRLQAAMPGCQFIY